MNPSLKTAIFAIQFVVVIGSAMGWHSMTEYERATEHGAKIRTTYVIVDDCENPVADAKVHIWLGLENHKDGGKVYYDYTDHDGRYVLDGKTTGLVRYSFVKDGYYETEGELRLEGAEDKQNAVRDGKWQPYGECKRIVLKRVRNPTAKPFHYGDLRVPVFGQWMGFDLEKFDLCPPYGKGIHKDVLLRYVFNKDPLVCGKIYASMEMTFTNNPYGGATGGAVPARGAASGEAEPAPKGRQFQRAMRGWAMPWAFLYRYPSFALETRAREDMI